MNVDMLEIILFFRHFHLRREEIILSRLDLYTPVHVRVGEQY